MKNYSNNECLQQIILENSLNNLWCAKYKQRSEFCKFTLNLNFTNPQEIEEIILRTTQKSSAEIDEMPGQIYNKSSCRYG